MLPYTMIIYPTINIYIIIARNNKERPFAPGTMEKDEKVRMLKSKSKLRNFIPEIPCAHQPVNSSTVHEPDPDRGFGWDLQQFHQFYCSTFEPQDVSACKVR